MLATHELIELLDRQKVDLNKFPDSFDASMEEPADLWNSLERVSSDPTQFSFFTQSGQTSNGYLEYIFRRASLELHNVKIGANEPLVYQQGKNRHY